MTLPVPSADPEATRSTATRPGTSPWTRTTLPPAAGRPPPATAAAATAADAHPQRPAPHRQARTERSGSTHPDDPGRTPRARASWQNRASQPLLEMTSLGGPDTPTRAAPISPAATPTACAQTSTLNRTALRLV